MPVGMPDFVLVKYSGPWADVQRTGPWADVTGLCDWPVGRCAEDNWV